MLLIFIAIFFFVNVFYPFGIPDGALLFPAVSNPKVFTPILIPLIPFLGVITCDIEFRFL